MWNEQPVLAKAGPGTSLSWWSRDFVIIMVDNLHDQLVQAPVTILGFSQLLIPRPFPAPGLDCLQYASNQKLENWE